MKRMHRIVLALAALLLFGASLGAEQARAESNVQDAICLMLESAAQKHGLPIEFFARLIWQESSFRAEAIGPITRNGARAQGIAQFMPGTAAERNLLDPLDPVQALPKAAEFLRELRGKFGNLGLAAAAYNAGPRRVSEWLAGTGAMPAETRNYVLAITGRSVEEWAKSETQDDARPAPLNCPQLIASVKRTPHTYMASLEERVNRATRQPWSVQLAAGFSRALALSQYSKLMSRFTKVIGNRDPVIDSSILRSRGTRPFYQVSIGAPSRSEADGVCTQIRSAGGACIVLRRS
ncbi:lytic transglycosylase domain-containing protein [Bradyrhizobium sp. LHD-71]|uniref:lytic transglycosylase domain-containing protein n=1 Tax=Bradyrhizobium sp. LHD-71 TaxID=3072141 RepID=UPI00280FF75D|nr:lytic transglycosylase domain-containing protein [Bradyrhizobium sp. LHD-71]MDQ8732692.1 lytic transglycosylase domain-containing protein [Bradyrhizobium sp. LHD-71]